MHTDQGGLQAQQIPTVVVKAQHMTLRLSPTVTTRLSLSRNSSRVQPWKIGDKPSAHAHNTANVSLDSTDSTVLRTTWGDQVAKRSTKPQSRP